MISPTGSYEPILVWDLQLAASKQGIATGKTKITGPLLQSLGKTLTCSIPRWEEMGRLRVKALLLGKRSQKDHWKLQDAGRALQQPLLGRGIGQCKTVILGSFQGEDLSVTKQGMRFPCGPCHLALHQKSSKAFIVDVCHFDMVQGLEKRTGQLTKQGSLR